MYLLVIWISFIVTTSFLEHCDQRNFLLWSGFMFGFTYLYNQVSPFHITIRTAILLFNVSGVILWYVAFVYNDFLSIDPISYESFICLFFVYIYLTLYLYLESLNMPKKVKVNVFKLFVGVKFGIS